MYSNIDSVRQAAYWYDKGLSIIQEKGVEENDLQFLGAFLEFYVHNRNQKNTEACFSAIKSYPFDKWPVNACATMGVYYESVGKSDSALFYYTYADERYGSDIYRRKNSLRNLYEFHLKRGNEHEAMRYAKLYIQYCDSVEEDQAIEQTAQADKMYQYWKDEEEQLRLERDVYRNKMLGAYGFAGFLVAVAGALGIWYAARKRVKKTADENTHLKKKQNELEEKVNSTHEQLDSIILKQKKERQRQNRIAVSHSEIVRIFKEESDKGKGFIDNEKWNILFTTIDSRFPDFKDRISEIYGEIDAKYLKFLYLLKAGFNKSAAANLLGDSRSTANYWCNKLRQLGNGLSVDDFFRNRDCSSPPTPPLSGELEGVGNS